MKFTVIIPARISSTRFPGKILHKINGLPMIEHVRRRALLSSKVDQVLIATCDTEIENVINNFGGKVIMTSSDHKNGTQRASEASKYIESDYVILLQGDEPCIIPNMLDNLISQITNEKGIFYNAVCPVRNKKTLYDKSSVKCAIDSNIIIQNCFRISPYSSPFSSQKLFIFKMLGLMAFEYNFLKKINYTASSNLAEIESIEQLNILYNKTIIKPFFINHDLPSVNYKKDLDSVNIEFEKRAQKKILIKTQKMNFNAI